MIYPKTEIRHINDIVGNGVVATEFIPKGTITWVQDDMDRIFSVEDAEKLSVAQRQLLDTYCFINRNGQKVLCWDNGKYVNHSFNPTCFSTAYDFEIAIRDIYPGEQLTDDYGYLNLEEPFFAADEGTGRKVVYPDDIVTYHKEWDVLVKSCLHYVFEVKQPMIPFVPEAAWKEFGELRQHPERMRSILECHYSKPITADNNGSHYLRS